MPDRARPGIWRYSGKPQAILGGRVLEVARDRLDPDLRQDPAQRRPERPVDSRRAHHQLAVHQVQVDVRGAGERDDLRDPDVGHPILARAPEAISPSPHLPLRAFPGKRETNSIRSGKVLVMVAEALISVA